MTPKTSGCALEALCGVCQFARDIPHPGAAPEPEPAPSTFFGKLFDEPRLRNWMNSFRRDIYAAKIADHERAIYCHRYPEPRYKKKADGCGEFRARQATSAAIGGDL